MLKQWPVRPLHPIRKEDNMKDNNNFISFFNRSIPFRMGLMNLIIVGFLVAGLMTVFMININQIMGRHIDADEQNRLLIISEIIESHLDEYSRDLKYDTQDLIFKNVFEDPENADELLTEKWKTFNNGDIYGTYYMISNEGLIVASSEARVNTELTKSLNDALLTLHDENRGFFISSDNHQIVFFVKIQEQDLYSYGYILFAVEFRVFYDSVKHYLAVQAPEHSFKFYINNELIIESGDFLNDDTVNSLELEFAPVKIEMHTSNRIRNNISAEIGAKLLYLAILTGIISTLLITIISSITMSRPIKILAKEISEISEGKRTQLSRIPRVAGEITYLSETFIKMHQSLERRRSQLEWTNKSLTTAWEEIKSTQEQLVTSEKMASIGHLAAGVAHEINNPTGYVYNNLTTLQEYLDVFKSMYSSIEKAVYARQSEDSKMLNESLDEVKNIIGNQDTQFIMSDINDLVEESISGTEKIKDIVQGLKNFARTENHVPKPGNINDALETALKLTRNELKYNCEIITDLKKVPVIDCMEDRLTQVFINILINAGNAISEHGKIFVSTSADDDWVTIKIKDTGSGIPAENISKLFEPFFTTKDIGKGTGLGLSISLGIIEDHNGTIDVESKVGEGTSFVIKLPNVRSKNDE